MPTDAPPQRDAGSPTGSGTALGNGAREAGHALAALGRALRWLAIAIIRGVLRTARWTRRAIDAQGAAESGLNRVIELHATSAAGDALVAAALAGTLFFAVPVGQARSKVALYLVTTMAPFVLIAPVIGPVLDRLRHGRRYALAATCAGRAGCALVISTALARGGDALRLYPAAFGVLVLSKAYGVTRQAGVPRVLPRQVPLVTANSRVALAGVVTSTVAAPLGLGLAHLAGAEWTLRVAAVVLLVGAVQSMRLPGRVDSAAGEEQVAVLSAVLPDAEDTKPRGDPPGASLEGRGRQRRGDRVRLRGLPRALVTALRVNAVLRAFAGFLTLFFAFVLRNEPLGGLRSTAGIAVLVASAALGTFLGTVTGARLGDRAPELIVRLVLLGALLAAAVAAWVYGLVTVAVAALVAGLAQTLGKLSSDAIVQRDVPERVRASVFARSETLLQLAWVIGGGIGTALTVRGPAGLVGCAVVLGLVLAWALRDGFCHRTTFRRRRPGRTRLRVD